MHLAHKPPSGFVAIYSIYLRSIFVATNSNQPAFPEWWRLTNFAPSWDFRPPNVLYENFISYWREYDHRRVDLISMRFHILTQGFRYKPCNWKKDYFFACCKDLGGDSLRGTWRSLSDFNMIYPEMIGSIYSTKRACYRRLSQLVPCGAILYSWLVRRRLAWSCPSQGRLSK